VVIFTRHESDFWAKGSALGQIVLLCNYKIHIGAQCFFDIQACMICNLGVTHIPSALKVT
jgi:hypothetical protein